MSANAIVVQQHTVSDIERIARAIAASKLFGVANPEQALTLCLVAQAEGRHPASAAQDYHIIQGKPSKKADAMLRDFLSGGGKVQWHQLDDTKADATFSHPAGGEVRISWDHERAKQAQISTPMWKKYPRQMLRARVVSEGVRTVFPMATSGMYVPEEVAEFAPSQPVQEHGIIEGTTSDAKQAAIAYANAVADSLGPPTKTNTNPDALPKAKGREVYTALQQELDACTTQEDIAALCVSKPFLTEFKKLPSDWQELLNQQKDALWESFAPKTPGYVEPNFDHIEETAE